MRELLSMIVACFFSGILYVSQIHTHDFIRYSSDRWPLPLGNGAHRHGLDQGWDDGDISHQGVQVISPTASST